MEWCGNNNNQSKLLSNLDSNINCGKKAADDKENHQATAVTTMSSSSPNEEASTPADRHASLTPTPRSSSPNAVDDDPVLKEILELRNDFVRLERRFEDFEVRVEDFEGRVEEGFDKVCKKLDAGFGYTLSASAAPVLENMQVPIVTEDLTSAVLAERGGGSATWTFLFRHLNGDSHLSGEEKVEDTGEPDVGVTKEFFLLSCAHCALEHKNTHGDVQFVVAPKTLVHLVDGVFLYEGKYWFADDYTGARKYDIVLLKLKRLPNNVDENRVLEWVDFVGQYEKQFVGAMVGGSSVKSPVIGRNAVYHDITGCWFYMRDSESEGGHSGTAMVCSQKDDGPKFVLDVDGDEKHNYQKPRLLGVHTGVQEFQDGLKSRGVICPMPRREQLKYFECCDAPASIKFTEKQGEEVFAVASDYENSGEIVSKNEVGTKSVLCGIFIKAHYEAGERPPRKSSVKAPKAAVPAVAANGCCTIL